MTTTHHTPAAGLLALVLTLFTVAASALVADSAAISASPTDGCTGPYAWPVKPFGSAHPVRGNFGDPRTVFHGKRSQRTIASGTGVFHFHHGVDISAPDGTAVFAVNSGVITRTRGDRVTIDCRNGRAFEYWHITVANIRVGQHAVAGKTLLGHILPKREHVHLTQLENGRPVNPLAPGRLTPYRDTTRPSVEAITFRRSDLGGAISPTQIAGRVLVYADVTDMPALSVPGRWHGFPVTPAVVTWKLETARGRVVVGERVAWDVRRTIPSMPYFWVSFARGTYQNWPVFSDGKARGMTGRYVFRLGAQPLDVDQLRFGAYKLIVSASDTAGNATTRVQTFLVTDR